jgi:hypothetical protein
MQIYNYIGKFVPFIGCVSRGNCHPDPGIQVIAGKEGMTR